MGRGKKRRRGGAREVYVVCINYLLRPTEPTCVCEADTALGSVYDTAIALVYLQCVVYVCVCHRSPVQVGVLVCVLYVCVCSKDCSSPKHTARSCYTWFISEFHITWTTLKPRPLSAVTLTVTKVRTHLLTPLL